MRDYFCVEKYLVRQFFPEGQFWSVSFMSFLVKSKGVNVLPRLTPEAEHEEEVHLNKAGGERGAPGRNEPCCSPEVLND